MASAAIGPSGAADSSFTITYTGVPAAECTKIISAMTSDFYMVQVNTTPVKTADGSADIADVSIACTSGENSNSLVLTSL